MWQVAQGLTQRGAALRTAASEYTLMDLQTLAGAICKARAQEMALRAAIRNGAWTL